MKKNSMITLPIMLFLFITLAALSIAGIKMPVTILLLFAAVFTTVIAWFLGHSWFDIQNAVSEKVVGLLPSVYLLIGVGCMLGTWMISGTLPMLIRYGLIYIPPHSQVLAAFVLTSIVSIITGTSWGAVGTIGFAMIGVAQTSGVPLAPIAGAIACGAYLGDKVSPLSRTTIIAATSAGADVYTHIFTMMKITFPAFIVSVILFAGFGSNYGVTAQGLQEIERTIQVISAVFAESFALWIPILVLFIGAILQLPGAPMMLLSSFVALINSLWIQDFTPLPTFNSLVFGFTTDIVPDVLQTALRSTPTMQEFLTRGGLSIMFPTLLTMIVAYFFTGTISVCGAFEGFAEKMYGYIRSSRSLVFITMLVGCIAGFLSEIYIALSVTGEIFKQAYPHLDVVPEVLSRTIEDVITAVQPFIPWTAAGIYISYTLGVPTIEYLPWAFLTYTTIIFSIISTLTGIGMPKISQQQYEEQEYVPQEASVESY